MSEVTDGSVIQDAAKAGKWSEHTSAVMTDAHQRLAYAGIVLSEYDMIAWASVYFRLKKEEAGRAGLFNVLCAFAVSEAAVAHEAISGE